MSDVGCSGARGDARIDIHDKSACRRWSALLGTSPEELQHIVHAVGDRVSDVENYLAEARLHAYFEDDNTEANPT